MIKFEIDGQVLEVEQGSTIIEAADNANIQIPRFCYHKKLSIAANCRMCLVEVEKAPKPMPACATPVNEGMVVKTKSAKALMAQRSVMEFLLINHPLDCPICDQGGECELQDVSMGYGSDISRFNQGKRAVEDVNIGPLIATGMTRCIHCTRCVRFGEEVAGLKELGMLGRGETSEIRTFLNGSVDSELSGNMIDLCPVGALTSKPYRFTARSWELTQTPTIAPHDSIGSNIYAHTVRNSVKRVVPKENNNINESWISDRDRFSYEGVHSDDRLLKPLIKVNGLLQETNWENALSLAVDYIKQQSEHDVNNLHAYLSPNTTVEEGYLLKKIIKSLGSNSIDFRNRGINQSLLNLDSDSNPNTRLTLGAHNIKLADVESSDCIFLFGGSPRKSAPMLNHKIRKAFLQGAKINSISSAAFDYNYSLNIDAVVSPEILIKELAGLAKQIHLLTNPNQEMPSVLSKSNVKIADYLVEIAHDLANSRQAVLIFGNLALNHPDAGKLYKILKQIESMLGCSSMVLADGANSIGLDVIGCKPSYGYQHSDTAGNLNYASGTHLLYNIEPEYDCDKGLEYVKKLKTDDNKVIIFTPYITKEMHEYADVVLPIASFYETSGTFVNIDQKWQSFEAAISAPGEARPGWRVVAALGQLLEIMGGDYIYESSQNVRQEAYSLYQASIKEDANNNVNEQYNVPYIDDIENLNSDIPSIDFSDSSSSTRNQIEAILVNETNCYKVDNLVRRSESLQLTKDAEAVNCMKISENIAVSLNLKKSDDGVFKIKINETIAIDASIDNDLPDNTAYLTMGAENSLMINKPYSKILIKAD